MPGSSYFENAIFFGIHECWTTPGARHGMTEWRGGGNVEKPKCEKGKEKERVGKGKRGGWRAVGDGCERLDDEWDGVMGQGWMDRRRWAFRLGRGKGWWVDAQAHLSTATKNSAVC